MRPTRKSTQHPGTRPGNIAPLSIDRVVPEQSLGNVVSPRKEKLDEDTSVTVSTQTVMDLLRDDRGLLRRGRHASPDDTDREKDEPDYNEAKRLAINGIAQRPGLSQNVHCLSILPRWWRLTVR